MQLLAYFKEHAPLRTLKFIWCGSEEMGLLGSIAYCKEHKEELKGVDGKNGITVLPPLPIYRNIAKITSDKSTYSDEVLTYYR